MAQQTAVEWYTDELLGIKLEFAMGVIAESEYHTKRRKAFEQAKQMEKEQIIKAHGDKGWAKPIIDDNGIPKKDGIAFGTTTGEQYYKETYNNTPS